MKGVEQKTNALGVGLGYAHEGCHLAVGYDGHTAVAAVLAQVVGRQVVVEVELGVGRGALQKHKAAHRGYRQGAGASGAVFVARHVFNAFMYEVGASVVAQLFLNSPHPLVVYKNIAPTSGRCIVVVEW